MKNRWMVANFDIMTPIGRGTIVGMHPDHKSILVMHSYQDRKGTFAKWWLWDDQKGEIVGEQETETKEE